MGSLAKKIGQITAKSMESESSQILRTIQSNKIPNSLSQRLDTTLKESHDMKVFGLGTLSSMANKERYIRFTHSMYGVYSTMENELDETSSSSDVVKHFWNEHEYILRRTDKLRKDIEMVGQNVDSLEYTPATQHYMDAIRVAGDNDRNTNGGKLLGHAYTRYLADLMGGQVLATPTKLALGLDHDVEQYSFDFVEHGMNRKEYVERIYKDLNIAGNLLSESKRVSKGSNDSNDDDFVSHELLEGIVDEARLAFQHNIKVYAEEPIYLDSIIGLKNIVTGYMFRR